MQDAPIVVAGAGIGGLTAALCLARAGRKVLVLERAPAIEEVGAGLQISPNAGRVLDGLGLAPALESVALEPEAFNIRRVADGATLARLLLAGARERWGAPFRVFHRADLQQVLLHVARAHSAIEIRTNARVGDFEEEGGVVSLRVHGPSGAEDIEASGLVGADGVRSSVRAVLVRAPKDAPVYAGHTAWRALIPAAALPAGLRRRETQLWLGPGAHVVHYPLRDAGIVSAVVIIESRLFNPASTLDGATLAHETGFTHWSAELRALLDAAPEWRRWPLYARPTLSQWSRGRVTLLGDAAHPMLPFLAQGAAQAIEDADALGRACAVGGALDEAFAAYEQQRRTRATRVQTASRRQGAFLHAGGLFGAARDLAIRALGDDRMLSRNGWLYR